jgi:2,4-dienoyl-CoA reductase-like NADH-dependent reductase (Old Yellow Enzyme family)
MKLERAECAYGEACSSKPPLVKTPALYLPLVPSCRYVHFVEPRIQGITEAKTADSLTPFRAVWKGTFLAAGGFDREKAVKAIEAGETDVVVFGRHWLANPGALA